MLTLGRGGSITVSTVGDGSAAPTGTGTQKGAKLTMAKKLTGRVLPTIEEKPAVSNTSDAENGRKNDRVNQRDWIDENGNATNKESEASGFRFTLRSTGEAIEHQFGEAGSPRTMFAIFGALTKLGNEINTVKAKGEPVSIEPARAFFDHLMRTYEENGVGEWGVPGQGGGPRINFERLRAALTARGEEIGQPVDKSMARLQPGSEDVEFAKQLLRNTGVSEHYKRLGGQAAVSDDEVFG